MIRRVLLFCLLMCLSESGFLLIAQETIECPDALPSRLLPDMIAWVTPGDPNRVRNMPSTEGDLIGEIPGESEFYVLNGPVCQDGFAWWYVEHKGLVGWTVEGGSSYWLEPVNADFVVPPRDFGEEEIIPFSFNGMTFDLSNQIAASATAEIVADTPPDSGAFSMDVAPEHTRVEFEGWEDLYFPYLAIYPADDYADYRNYPLYKLQTTLAERPDEPDYVGPIVNAAIPFYVQPAYVDFVNGSGVRAIVHWTQNLNLITDGGIDYIYAGLTDDGQYLVHMVIPLESPILPTYLTVIGENWDYMAFGEVYSEYMDTAEMMIAQHPPESFYPRLSQLDALIGSLDLTNYNQDVMQDAAGNECVTLRSRLVVDEFARQVLVQDSLRVRDEPGGTATGNNVLSGELMRVLSGPVCADNVAWWEIESNVGWSGWVAEGGQESYFFEPVTRTPTPTATFTPSPTPPTATPSATSTRRPTPTPAVSDCIITPIFNAVLRSEPHVDAFRGTTIYNTQHYYATSQFQREGEDFPWWQLGSRANYDYTPYSVVGRWIRADFVTEEGNCDSLPVYEYEDE